MNPICVKCNREMSRTLDGVVVYHPYEIPEPGPISEKVGNLTLVHTDRLLTYDLEKHPIDFVVNGDKYRCPVCGYEIISSFGEVFVDHLYPQDMFKKMIKNAKLAVQLKR